LGVVQQRLRTHGICAETMWQRDSRMMFSMWLADRVSRPLWLTISLSLRGCHLTIVWGIENRVAAATVNACRWRSSFILSQSRGYSTRFWPNSHDAAPALSVLLAKVSVPAKGQWNRGLALSTLQKNCFGNPASSCSRFASNTVYPSASAFYAHIYRSSSIWSRCISSRHALVDYWCQYPVTTGSSLLVILSSQDVLGCMKLARHP